MTTALARPPSVSVIVPTFNRLKYLRCALASVFAQTLADWELVIADDGSQGETRAYLRGLQSEPRVSVIWLPHCGNPAAVRNCAIRQARGEYLAFLDSDDEWLPSKLQRQIGALRAGGARRWSYTGYSTIDARGAPCAQPVSSGPHQGALLEPLLLHQVSIWTPGVVAERRLVVELGGFDEQLLLFEDYDLWLRLACRSEIDFIDEPLTRVRRAHGQHHSELEHGDDMLACRQRSLGKLRAHVTEPRLRSLLEHLFAQTTLQLAAVRADSDRIGAAKLLLRGGASAWRYKDWWPGLARVALKLAAPRAVLAAYRRGRVRRRSVSAQASR
jgi:glycosyltransferase involved in cell wall biosynthesis